MPESSSHPDTAARRDRALKWLAVTLVAVLAFGFLFPVVAGPVTGDDRYWFPWMGSDASWTPLTELTRIPQVLDTRMEYGRVNFLTEIERRTVAKLGIELSVATRTPLTVYNAAIKVVLAVVALLCVLALLRTMRWRSTSGRLVRISGRSLALVTAAGTLGVAVVARPHTAAGSTLNGWNSYPWSTYGAVPAIFGVVALCLWLSRRAADGGRGALVVAMSVMAVLGLATPFRYELAFPAVPLAVVALLVVPVTDRARERAGRRAKLLVGIAYVGTFLPAFVATRLMLRASCAENSCYEGVSPQFGGALIRTLVYNVLSTFPGGDGGMEESVRAAGLGMALPVGPTTWSVLAGLLVALALGLGWWCWRPQVPDRPDAADDDTAEPSESDTRARAETILLAVAAGLFLLGAVGAAGVMAFSERSQSLTTAVGVLNRNAVVTAVGVVFAIVLAVVALCRSLPRRAAVVPWAVLTLAIAVTGAVSLPDSVVMLRSQRISAYAADSLNRDLVVGDLRERANERRCEVMHFLIGRDGEIGPGSTERLLTDVNNAFQRYYGRPFCVGDEVVTSALEP